MPTHPVFTTQTTALVTGAASGIGLAFAKLCRRHGLKVALVDVNDAGLSSAAKYLDCGPDTVRTYTTDVSKIEDWKDLKARVEMDFGLVGLLMLNAGIAPKSGWEDVEYFHKIMDTNVFGVINGISTFLPSLRTQNTTATSVVITGSKQGITNPPGNPAYNASKAAVKSLAEHLSYDLRGTKTSVHLLVPGWTHTGLTKAPGIEDKPAGAWWPEQVVEYLENKMGEGAFYAICPDSDVTEEKDKKRMLWTTGDMLEGRPPLSRWRDGYKDDAERWMEKQEV
ncbi:MAG: hypothetical protein Q9217_005576 [Psora testacea]